MILEEFGVTDGQAATYTAWYNSVISSGLTGDLIWWVSERFRDQNTWLTSYEL